MKKLNNDKIIKSFFSDVLAFLEYEKRKPGVDKKAIQHNISCMSVFRCNPAKFTRPKQIKVNKLFVTPDGLGGGLFDVVKQMIVAVHIHYNVEPKGAFCAEKQIPQLYKQSKLIMMKNDPRYLIRTIIFHDKVH